MSSSPKVFVHEYISGGGWPAGNLPEGLISEGLAMLWSVLSDFRDWAAVQTVTTLDERINDQTGGLKRKTLPADQIISVSAGQYEEIFRSTLGYCDAVLIIAPETDGILTRLTEIAEVARVPILGSNSRAIKATSNKAICDQLFRQHGFPTPNTQLTSFEGARAAAHKLGYPIVTKPLDGTGCEGVCLVTAPSQLDGALALLRKSTYHERFLLQSYVHGTHASVSMLVAQDGAMPLSLNGQQIREGCPFHYSGSCIPLEHPGARHAFDLAKAAVSSVPGLGGYVGVDMILEDDKVWLIEINPRITTSYVGLRRVATQNLAKAIWYACLENVLPDQFLLNGSITFSKENPDSWMGN